MQLHVLVEETFIMRGFIPLFARQETSLFLFKVLLQVLKSRPLLLIQ